jgi:glucose-1-phosphate cytidylyltransferase
VKVVIFCGGLGVRMGEETQRIPKPMINVGARPILWHIMKWYASWGFDDFILCLGYKAEIIKQYFLDYNEALSNDFVLSNGGLDVQLLGTEISSWRITFVDTGAKSTIGERLLAIAPYLGDDPYFLATYGDGLTDVPLPDMIDRLRSAGKTALFLSVRPLLSLHVVDVDAGADGVVTSIEDMQEGSVWINGGFFVFRRDVLDYVNPEEELVVEPFQRLIEQGQLLAYRYEGFWEPMDTIKDKQRLDALAESGHAPGRVRRLPNTSSNLDESFQGRRGSCGDLARWPIEVTVEADSQRSMPASIARAVLIGRAV